MQYFAISFSQSASKLALELAGHKPFFVEWGQQSREQNRTEVLGEDIKKSEMWLILLFFQTLPLV